MQHYNVTYTYADGSKFSQRLALSPEELAALTTVRVSDNVKVTVR